MKRLRAVHIGWWHLAAIIVFAVLYYLLPYRNFLILSLNMAFAAALAAVVRYAIDGYYAIKAGRGGMNFLLTSLLSIFMTILVQRSWTMGLDALDRPEWMVSSFMTILIPFMMAFSVSLSVVAPDIEGTQAGANFNLGRSILIFVLGILAGAFFYAYIPSQLKEYVGLYELPQLANRPSCADTQPVWGSQNKVYHIEDSPYRGMVIPDWCFASTEEAEEKGFRSPKGVRAD